jgi:bifunctional DNA-binding transcriptional regulator/antitoxin component of YhaV-PrlF toxin-antitoxin module
MKLISQKHAEYKGKDYYKHWVVIPNKLIQKLGWEPGEELEAEVKNGKLVIKKDD